MTTFGVRFFSAAAITTPECGFSAGRPRRVADVHRQVHPFLGHKQRMRGMQIAAMRFLTLQIKTMELLLLSLHLNVQSSAQ